MKTVRIALTAAMLLSLHATSFSMEPIEQPTLTRTLSHDGTRKVLTGYSGGMFGSGIDTLDKLGQPYANGYVYALGSDEQAPHRWAQVGKNDIKTVAHAHKYTAAVKAKGWNSPEEAMQPSANLMKTDYEEKNAKVKSCMIALATIAEKSFEDVDNLQKLAADAIEARKIYNTNFSDRTIEKRTLHLNNAKYLTEKNINLFIQNFMDKQPKS